MYTFFFVVVVVFLLLYHFFETDTDTVVCMSINNFFFFLLLRHYSVLFNLWLYNYATRTLYYFIFNYFPLNLLFFFFETSTDSKNYQIQLQSFKVVSICYLFTIRLRVFSFALFCSLLFYFQFLLLREIYNSVLEVK